MKDLYGHSLPTSSAAALVVVQSKPPALYERVGALPAVLWLPGFLIGIAGMWGSFHLVDNSWGVFFCGMLALACEVLMLSKVPSPGNRSKDEIPVDPE